MRTRRNVALGMIVFFAAIGSCTAPAPPSAELTAKDVADIKAVIERWRIAFVENKRDDLANVITADVVLMPPNVQPFVGKDAAMGYMKAFPAITRFDVTTDEVIGRGDVAYVRGTYSLDLTLADSTKAHDQGSFLEIHHKQADGSWPYTRLIWHSNDPVPAAAVVKQ